MFETSHMMYFQEVNVDDLVKITRLEMHIMFKHVITKTKVKKRNSLTQYGIH